MRETYFYTVYSVYNAWFAEGFLGSKGLPRGLQGFTKEMLKAEGQMLKRRMGKLYCKETARRSHNQNF